MQDITTVLGQVHGGRGLGYATGYVAGQLVTRAIAPFNQETAFTQVGGPFLRRHGFPNAADGAEAAVRDVAAEYGHPVIERR